MEPFLNSLSLTAREKLRKEGIDCLSDLDSLSVDDLKSLLSFSTKDILSLRKTRHIDLEYDRHRKRHCEEDPSDSEPYPPKTAHPRNCARPSTCTGINAKPLAGTHNFPAGDNHRNSHRSEPRGSRLPPKTRDRFAGSKRIASYSSRHRSRLMQCILKAAYPGTMGETITAWNTSFDPHPIDRFRLLLRPVRAPPINSSLLHSHHQRH